MVFESSIEKLSSFFYLAPSYKNFFILNSAEHEILNAHKYKHIKKFCFFPGSDKPIMLFFLLLIVRMPTIVGILTFMSRKNFSMEKFLEQMRMCYFLKWHPLHSYP